MMNSGEHTVDEAFNLMISYIADISPKYAELIVASHSSVAKKKDLETGRGHRTHQRLGFFLSEWTI